MDAKEKAKRARIGCLVFVVGLTVILLIITSIKPRPVMDPELIKFFHGIDLGMRGSGVSILGPALKYSDENDLYQGIPIADSAVFMRMFAPSLIIPFWPFTAFEHVDDIWLEFSDSIKTPATQASLSYWIDFFSSRFGKMPNNYALDSLGNNSGATNKYLRIFDKSLGSNFSANNEYLWIFDKYCFETDNL